jgi:hypothetical protein
MIFNLGRFFLSMSSILIVNQALMIIDISLSALNNHILVMEEIEIKLYDFLLFISISFQLYALEI